MDPQFKAYLIERKRAIKGELKWIETTLDAEKDQSQSLPRFLQPASNERTFLTGTNATGKMK